MARGRKSLFREEYIQLAENYALLGATDDELADFFGVSKQTLNKWKKDYPEFLDSLKRGKDIADSNVASKLYNRAIGYDFEETHTVCKNGLVVGEKHIKKHQLADTTAAIFWLKNRQRDRWQDRPQDYVDQTSDNDAEVQIYLPDNGRDD